jgi:hypothetical protein
MQTQARPIPMTAHDYVVRRLAQETNASEEEARRAYESQLETLARGARITTFVSALARRRALEILRHH